jgi:hypothetical protein
MEKHRVLKRDLLAAAMQAGCFLLSGLAHANVQTALQLKAAAVHGAAGAFATTCVSHGRQWQA